jgi:hypothetical protein
MFDLALDAIGYTFVRIPLVINCAHIYLAKEDFTFENSVLV